MTTNIDLAKIAAKTESAKKFYDAMVAKAADIAAHQFTAKAWADYAADLAEAEGILAAWTRLSGMVTWQQDHDEPVTGYDVLYIVGELLGEGADDTWSGRGNDTRRAHHDGVVRACRDMRRLAR